MIRRLPFAGALNFRDIGGYSANGAGQTRWGAVYRSDSLHFLTTEDLAAFDALNIKTIYDLRRLTERAEFPGPRETFHIEVGNRPFDPDQTALLKTHRDGQQWLLGDYLAMMAKAAPTFGDLFGRLADRARLPVVIHCMSGKDRTGLAIAMLLTALGVSRETVLDDYELSNSFRGAEQMPDVVELFVQSGIARDAAEGLLSAPRWAMATALDELEETYAGIDNYLLGPAGMSSVALDELRSALVS
jgi:protein-tyrosine phosphatase